MALIYELVWRVLHVLLHIQRALILWLRICLRTCKGRLLRRAVAALLMPIALAGFPEYHKKLAPATGKRTGGRHFRWCADGKSLEKVPLHVGLLIAEEEPSYTDVANLVVWCMAVGISYVSVYDNRGVFQKNNAILLEAIVRRQQEVLGPDGSKYNMEFTSNGNDKHQYQVLSCQSVVKVLSPEDGKQSIVQVAQQLCRAVEQKEKNFKDIDVSTIDTLLRDSKKFPDPELVLKFGQIDSTLGFLPWHIRLTEFISMPSHIDVSYEDLYGALQRYAACEQRLGK
ncbi:dehydrodolichyl diphosphate synthase complex subunit nus1 [Lampris incognitus]|uniref:dehydrodolichyl diphosphate synthase complex subunit nus1 n=1 Tax=Lampris incognitus TaxID=2546036 RepID=UPI0024B601F9|nr:dehydrodolichyl diphosphate synthase complex subunit nus1 [Lampris incognitus]